MGMTFVDLKEILLETVRLTNLSILPETDEFGFFYARAEYEFKTTNGSIKKLIIPRIELPFNKYHIPVADWHFNDRMDRNHVCENIDGFYYLAFENAALPLRKHPKTGSIYHIFTKESHD